MTPNVHPPASSAEAPAVAVRLESRPVPPTSHPSPRATAIVLAACAVVGLLGCRSGPGEDTTDGTESASEADRDSSSEAPLPALAEGALPDAALRDVASPDEVDGTADVEPLTPPEVPPGAGDRAVTHLGRTLLPETDAVVIARVERVTDAGPGLRLARLSEVEPLRGAIDVRPHVPCTALCGEDGLLPRQGRDGVFFLRTRPGSYGHVLVQVMPLTHAEADERLAVLRRYLEIEDTPGRGAQLASLLGHLREAVTDRRRWTRANAALEYGSLADAYPSALGARDVAVLEAAHPLARDGDARSAIEHASEVARRNAAAGIAGVEAAGTVAETPADASAAAAADESETVDEDALLALVASFERETDPSARRTAVVAAARDLGPAALPLVRRGLDDASPVVAEAAVAAAATLDLVGLGERVEELLETAVDPALRHSAVRAVGWLRRSSAVPRLARLAALPSETGDEALEALARIRDEAALTALDEISKSGSVERAVHIEELLSGEFVAREREAGREVGPR